MTSCCALSSDGADRGAVVEHRQLIGRRDHHCCECQETIARGTQHEIYKVAYDGYLNAYRTCLLCVEIRDHFACAEGWIFGEVWQQLEYFFFPDMKAGGPCMEGLSPGAKQRLFDRRLAWLESQ